MNDTTARLADTLLLDVLGVRVAVTVPEPVPSALLELLGPLVAAPPPRSTGDADGRRADCVVQVQDTCVESVVGAALAAAVERSPHLLVHASAVARDGQAVLFPGPSGTGKSTLAAACVTRGFDYVTDEAVAVDLRSARVSGLARPLMVTGWAAATLRLPGAVVADEVTAHPIADGVPWAVTDQVKLAVAAAALGARTVSGSVPVTHVVAMDRSTGVTALRKMTAGETLERVLSASFNHYRHGIRAWETAATLVGAAQGWHLDVADPVDAAVAVRGLFES